MNTVQEMLEVKGHVVWSVNRELSVFELVQKMAEKKVGALTVVDDKDNLVGIVSERDYTRKMMLLDKDSHQTHVSDIMTEKVLTVFAESTIEKCMALMSENSIRHLPVVRGSKLIGIISVGDLLKAIIEKQSETIEELESFIYEESGGEG